jgi:hypothetical protein
VSIDPQRGVLVEISDTQSHLRVEKSKIEQLVRTTL